MGLTACSGGGGGGDKDTDTNTDNGGGGDDDDDTTTPPSGETGGSTTGTYAGPFTPVAILVIGQMFYDSASGNLVTATQGGNSLDSRLIILLGDQTWSDVLTGQSSGTYGDANVCALQLPLTSAAPASWALGNPDIFLGVDYTGGVDAAETDCGDATHPLDNFGPLPGATTDQFIDAMVNQAGPWGMGIGNPSSLFDGQTTGNGADLADVYVGGYVPSPFLTPTADPDHPDVTELNHYNVEPISMDPNTFEVDNTTDIPVDQVFDGTTLATGAYILSDFFIFGI